MQEALTGFNHVPSPDCLNTMFLSQGWVLGAVSRSVEGKQNMLFKDRGVGGSSIGWVWLAGQLVVNLLLMTFSNNFLRRIKYVINKYVLNEWMILSLSFALNLLNSPDNLFVWRDLAWFLNNCSYHDSSITIFTEVNICPWKETISRARNGIRESRSTVLNIYSHSLWM